VDELYDGEFCLLVATDPLADMTVGLQRLGQSDADAEQVAKFLDYLTDVGAKPDVLITDESKLYPAALRDSTWNDVSHQLCNFHFLRLIVRDAAASVSSYVQTMPKDPKRKRGRPPKRGRPRSQHNKERKVIRDARFLITANPKNLTEEKAKRLQTTIDAHPALLVTRDCMEKFYSLFGSGDQAQAELIRQEILTDKRFRADPHLAKSVARLEDDERFQKLVLFLNYENLDRTSNHVERDNRRFRKRQKAHYRLRLRETISNALNLKVQAERRAKSGLPTPKLQLRSA
jgi:hypothetical protein